MVADWVYVLEGAPAYLQYLNKHFLCDELTHYGLLTHHGNIYLDQRWLRKWLVTAWRHQAITWTKVDLPSVGSSAIHMSASVQGITQQKKSSHKFYKLHCNTNSTVYVKIWKEHKEFIFGLSNHFPWNL